MENFQYSVQLSDQDWAEFSATTDECGLLQAGLASGDELLSSDIDQGDSSGSSPPGPPPLPIGQQAARGSGQWGCGEEDVAPRWLVSRSQCEPVLDPGSGQQTPSTSTRSASRLSLGSGTSPPGQSSNHPGPESSGDKMQRLQQGPGSSSPGEPPRSSEAPGHGATPPRPPENPGASPRSPGRKKRRAKGGGHSGAPGPAPAQLGSLLPRAAWPEEDLGLARPVGRGPVAGPAELTAGAGQDALGLDSTAAAEPGPKCPEQVARRGPRVGLSTPVPVTEQGADQVRMTPRAEIHTASTSVQDAHQDVLRAKPDTAVSTPASEPPPDTDTAVSTPASKPPLDMGLSTLASKPRLNVNLLTAGPVVEPEVASSTPISGAMPIPAVPHSGGGVSPPAPRSDAATPGCSPAPQAGPDVGDTEVAVSPGGHREKPRGEPSGGASGQFWRDPLPGPAQAPRKKKVRFSMAVSSPEESGSERAPGSPSPATAWSSAGSYRGPGARDAVALGPRQPQPRILKHLPPVAPSTLEAAGYRACFAVTLPEAYEFFFCDTIEEEDEDTEDAATTSQALEEVQWPDVCEFFFRDSPAQPSRQQGGHSQTSPPRAEHVPAPPPGDPVAISIPEAYEHFFGDERAGDMLGSDTLLQLQASEFPRSASWGPGPGTPVEPATATQLSQAVRWPGELRGPLTSLTLSQNDMCLVFVAFASWAVRTSDLHTPDAWKTVLLANIGTISAIRYFRRQVGQGRRSCGPSRSPSPSA
ncbi:PGC-1 and ERR-induced regulator in muscle protein 1 [Carlito syrichta]|uniref:PGC-1 and ERR-induced regulator in muscle protein 1 n=1 Tax=Carlito syrichta TaxID=1868482 RepID=A0A1U7TRR3_CARSF|nr:PGC-1 and ERR-induced regulator in muscle protein 1 [Carlito syrichta]